VSAQTIKLILVFTLTLGIAFVGLKFFIIDRGPTPSFATTLSREVLSASSGPDSHNPVVDFSRSEQVVDEFEEEHPQVDFYQFLTNNPQFKRGLTERFFDLISEKEFADSIAAEESPIPKNDGRFEFLDENGNVLSRSYTSPEEDDAFGLTEIKQYPNEDLLLDELKTLDLKHDPAASLEPARNSYAMNDRLAGDEYMLRAAKFSGKPAALSIAGDYYYSPPLDGEKLIMASAWYLASFVSGDHTVASRLRLSLGQLPPDMQEIAIDQAFEILDEVGG
jgi:hypothetical protein